MKGRVSAEQMWLFFNEYPVLLTGDEGNIWYVGPEDKRFPDAEGRGQHFVFRSNVSYVARIPSQ